MSLDNASSPTSSEISRENPNAEPQFELPTWEEDETTGTRLLRAIFTLVAGGLLAWAQWHAPAEWLGYNGQMGQFWGRWVLTSVVFNFVIPLGIVWMFFGQGLWHQDWLKDQKNNAWDYGWNWKNWRRHALIALGVWAIMLPAMWYFSGQSEVRASYASYLPPVNSLQDWAFLLGTLVVYMFCWEWFFRGFGLFGMAPGFGPAIAIIVQAIGFGLAHAGKPELEMASSFVGGLALGVLCWREKSFVPAFLIHALIHVTWTLLVLR